MSIPYNDDDVSLKELKSHFSSYMSFPDYSPYIPFLHGTTKARANQILKEGLLTRVDCKDEKIAQCNIWGSHNPLGAKSGNTKTYFMTCNEMAGVGTTACEKAWEKDNIVGFKTKYIHDEYKNLIDFRHDQCAYIRLKNWEKYKDRFALDEDSKAIEICLKAMYNDKPLYKKSEATGFVYEEVPYGCLHVIERMPSNLIDYYDLAYTYGGTELAHELIEATPKALHSITEWGTVAVEGSIEPEDIDAITYEEYKTESKCRTDIENKSITAIDKCTENPHCLMHNYHNKTSIDFFKKYVKDNVRDYLKRLEIR